MSHGLTFSGCLVQCQSPSRVVRHVQGFYVMLDFHSNRYGNSLASGNESLYDQASWIQSWVALVKSVLANTPAANGKLLIDLINEPDGCAVKLAFSTV